MKYLSILAFFILGISTALAGETRGLPQQVSAVLGVPFGTIVEIRGTIADIADTGMKRDEDRTLIYVQEIKGKKVEKPFYLPLATFSFARVGIPGRGSLVTLRGYEEGSFRGIPGEAFKDIPIVANDGFRFESYFRITAIIADYTTKTNKNQTGVTNAPRR